MWGFGFTVASFVVISCRLMCGGLLCFGISFGGWWVLGLGFFMAFVGFPGFDLTIVGFLADLVSYGVGIIYGCCVVGFIGTWRVWLVWCGFRGFAAGVVFVAIFRRLVWFSWLFPWVGLVGVFCCGRMVWVAGVCDGFSLGIRWFPGISV